MTDDFKRELKGVIERLLKRPANSRGPWVITDEELKYALKDMEYDA